MYIDIYLVHIMVRIINIIQAHFTTKERKEKWVYLKPCNEAMVFSDSERPDILL